MADECANPLLAQWMKERWDVARERNTKDKVVYKKAYESLTACPLRLEHPSEAVSLQGIGPKLADWLTDKMNEYCDACGIPQPKKVRGVAKRRAELEEVTDVAQQEEGVQPWKRAKSSKQYIPKLKSGGYAILVALGSQPESQRGMTKAELQREAQPYCDSSFTVPSDPTKFFTAWKSMETLTKKELVCIVGGRQAPRYVLTEEGWEVVQQIHAAERSAAAGHAPATISTSRPTLGSSKTSRLENPKGLTSLRSAPGLSSIVSLDGSPERRDVSPNGVDRFEISGRPRELPGQLFVRTDTFPSFEPICLPAGSFTVQLVLDNREVRTPADRDYISRELQKRGVVPVIRSLDLGDALWVAKIEPNYVDAVSSAIADDESEGNDEIMLDYIMERKRLDDLISSIKDGRFREQKYRLRRSGVKNVIYLVEQYSMSAEKTETYGDSVESAIASVQIVNEFFVKQTAKLDETVQYLANMTKMLRERYQTRDLHVIPLVALGSCNYPSAIAALRKDNPDIDHHVSFSAFAALCDKSYSLTLRDTFLKMLMCIKGLTGEKAIEIQRKWATPKALIDAFDSLRGDDARKSMVSEQLSGLIPRKRVAKALSAKIAEVWG